MYNRAEDLQDSQGEKYAFGNLTPTILSHVVVSYVKRIFIEDLEALLSLVESKEAVTLSLCNMLQTQKDYGISTQDTANLLLREQVFGRNRFPTRTPTSFWSLLYTASKDFVLRILMVSGLVSLGLSFISNEDSGLEWVDGLAIFLAVIIVLGVTACNDYLKEKQFSALNKRREVFCTVVRDGVTQKINAEDLYVGDVLFVEVGDELPADCFVLYSQQLTMDESSMTGESDATRKECFEKCLLQSEQYKTNLYNKAAIESGSSHHLIPSPIVLSGSIVMDGTGVLLAIAVGNNSEGGQLMNKLVVDTSPTSLQNKLNGLARDIGVVGFTAAVITFFIYLIQFWVNYIVDEGFREVQTVKVILDRHVKFLVQAITILVVAVPEGLPLAVTLSLAFSIRRMLRDQNYVRRLAACETMGSASDVLLDKTGTLTKNFMTVELIWSGSLPPINKQDTPSDSLLTFHPRLFSPQTFLDQHLSDAYRNLFIESIAVNSTAHLHFTRVDIVNGSMDHVKTIGSPTEGALLYFLFRIFNCDYESIRRHFFDHSKIVHCIPFTSARKLMTTTIKHPTHPNLYRAYVKGGADVVFHLCTRFLKIDGSQASLLTTQKEWVENHIIRTMSCQGLRTVCVAYRDFDPKDYPDWKELIPKTDSRHPCHSSVKCSTLLLERTNTLTVHPLRNIDLYPVELNLTCIGIVGIRDPVRDEVPAAVRRCQQAGIRVRMVTGDNIDTAKQIAIECHIYNPEQGGIAMTGSEFYQRIGGVVCERCRTEICDCPLYITKKHGTTHGQPFKRVIEGEKSLSPSHSDILKKRMRVRDETSAKMQKGVGESMKDGVEEQGLNVSRPHRLLCCVAYVFKLLHYRRAGGKLKGDTPSVGVRQDVIGNLTEFKHLVANLDVLARSQPLDKYAMVVGLKSLGSIVAVTGDGTNDAPALKKADIGFAMGISGKEVAKQAADIVIMDDNFESIVKAIKWGRSIFDNVRKFLLFQLTVNIVAVCIALVGSILIGESPLNAVQLLWVNLIMDSFASLALATEPASDDLLDRPHSANEYLINRIMMRNILGQVFYQLVVMLILIFTGECWIPEETSSYSSFEGVNGFSEFSKTCGGGKTVTSGRPFHVFSQKELYQRIWIATIGPSRHFTIVFNTFVCLQIVNLWNARRIDSQASLCHGVFSSFLWWIVLLIISVTQIILVQFGGVALGCHKQGLTVLQWLICIAIALGGIFVELLLHCIPAERMSFIPQTGKKETDILAESRNLPLASRGRISTQRLSSRMAAGLHNETTF